MGYSILQIGNVRTRLDGLKPIPNAYFALLAVSTWLMYYFLTKG